MERIVMLCLPHVVILQGPQTPVSAAGADQRHSQERNKSPAVEYDFMKRTAKPGICGSICVLKVIFVLIE